MSILSNTLRMGASQPSSDTAYQIEKSLRFDDGDTPYLLRQASSNGNTRTWTWSGWIKRGNIVAGGIFSSATGGHPSVFLKIDNVAGQFEFANYNGSYLCQLKTTQVLRDPSAWFHIVVAVDTTDAIAASRNRIYVNGKEITAWATQTNFSQNVETQMSKSDDPFRIGDHDTSYFDGYLSDVYLIDGLALSPAAFGEFSSAGAWNPKTFALPAPNQGTTYSSSATSTGSVWDKATNNNNLFTEEAVYDGDLNTAAGPYEISGTIGTLTLPVGNQTGKHFYRIHGRLYADGKWEDQDGNLLYTSTADNDSYVWYDLGWHSDITSLKITAGTSGNASTVHAIEVDGVILRDGFTDPTTRSNPNNGTTWSDYLVSSTGSFYGGMPATNAFNGNLSNAADASSTGGTMTFTPPSVITFDTLEMYAGGAQGGDQVITLTDSSDATTQVTTTVTDWVTVKSGGGTLKSLAIVASGNYSSIYGIRIDGHVLIDNAVDNSFHLKFNDTAANRNIGYSQLMNTPTGAQPMYGPGADDSAKSNLVLALPGYDLNDHSATIKGSGSNKTITLSNSDPSVSSAQSKFYGSAIHLDGNDAFTCGTSSDFNMGTGDFTAEGWFWFNSIGSSGTLMEWDNNVSATGSPSGTTAGGQWYFSSSNGGTLMWYQDSTNYATAAGKIEAQKWTHLAVVVTGGAMKMYQNGVEISSQSYSLSLGSSGGNLRIGQQGGTSYFNGYINDFRVYKASAKYTSTFTLPTRNDFTVNNLVAAASNQSDVSVASAGGALPIFNTTDTYGRVKGSGNRTDSVSNPYLWLPMDGSNNGTTFTDASGEGHSVTVVGDVKTVTSESKFYGSSAYFDGSGDYLNLGDHNQWISTGDFTVEFWVKFAHAPDGTSEHLIGQSGSGMGNASWDLIRISSSGSNGGKIQLELREGGYPGSGGYINLYSDNQINDDLWHHIALSLDSNTARMFIDGVVQSDTDTTDGTGLNTGTALTIGAQIHSSGRFPLQGWMQDVRIYGDGKYTSTFTVPNDPNVFPASELDVLNDTPTNYEDGGTVHGNFCTLNPLAKSSILTLSQGNLNLTSSGTTGRVFGTIGVSSGKWYYEYTTDETTVGVGISQGGSVSGSPGMDATSYAFIVAGGNAYKQTNGSESSYGSTPSVGDVIGCAFDLDAGTITMYKNNTSMGEMYSSITSGTYMPVVGDPTSSANIGGNVNFGARPFKYTPPANHKALCTQNLDDTFSGAALNNPSYYFDVQTYTGTGASNVKNFNFKPGVVWGKMLSAQNNHALASIELNGYETSKYLRVDTTDAWQSGGGGPVTTWGDTSVTLGSQDRINGDGGSYVLYAWAVGASANASDISDSSTGNKTVLAGDQWVSTAGGFSLTFIDTDGDDANFSHGLNAAPEFIFAKKLNSTSHWHVYHDSVHSGGGYLNLEDSGQGSTSSTGSWKQAPDASKIYVHDNFVNGDWLYFAFTPIPGYSAFGKATGNASTDGPFVYTGFKPRWVLWKGYDVDSSWGIIDTARSPYNVADDLIVVESDDDQDSGNSNWARDILSNGFKIRGSHSAVNGSNKTFVWAAFAEHPFKTSRAR